MAKAYFGSRISDNKYKTPEGYLICKNVPVARIGIQQYLGSEFGAEPADRLFNVRRPENEVFDKAAVASFEGKPVVDDHPDEDVTPNNYSQYMKGVCRDVRRGDGEFKNCLVADLIIYDAELIKKIEQGKREISCGYDCYWNPTGESSYDQLEIRGNHVAVVDNGRAGHGVCIRDSAEKIKERGKKPMSKDTLWGKLLSAFAKDSETSPEDLVAAAKLAGGAEAAPQPKPAPAPVQPAPAPAAPAAPAPVPAKPVMDAEIDARFKRIEDALAGIQAKLNPQPAAPAPAAPAPAPAAPKPEAKDEDVPEETALDALEGELEAPAAAPVPAAEDSCDEASVEADPQAINAACDEDIPAEVQEEPACDEDLIVEEGSEQFSQATKDSAKKIVAAFKPLIANIPNAEQRRKAADSLAILIKGNMQADSQYGEVQRITRSQRAHDKAVSDVDYGKMIRDKFNPHYRK